MIHKITRGRPWAAAALLSTTVLIGASTVPLTATASDDASGSPRVKQGTTDGVMQHLINLEEIGDDHGGRASGTPGYAASRDYVVKKLRKSGYDPTVQEFPFAFFEQLGPSTFEQTAPTPTTYVEDTEYLLMTYSGAGDVTAPVQGVDLNLADPATSTSGCEASDFAGFTAGNIALIRRGTCTFGQKVSFAKAAGASAVIIMNQGNAPDRMGVVAGTLGEPLDIPALGTTFAIGESLAVQGAQARVVSDTVSEIRQTWNVLAETTGRKKNVVMAGAHLDTVLGANGINDNGSGSAALLETAEKMATRDKIPNNRVRFAWWGAEELGLLGSEHYVAKLSENRPNAFQKIALYLNFDMVSSPNYMLGVYDGNNSAFPVGPNAAEGPQGSGAIERMFHKFFDSYGTGSVETAFSGRSDYGPFIALNVPAGGLFTGAEGVKTAEQAVQFGGTAGEAYDECYHQACDDLGNVSRRALKANTAAIMHAVAKYARTTRSVNGTATGHQPPAEPTPRHAHRTAHRHPGDPVAR